MTLLHPGWLWLLALAAPLLALHLRRRRRVRVVVPSLLALDPRALAEAPPRAAGIRPRDLLGLLLEVAALACLSLAAAGPVHGKEPGRPRPLAIVLDGSASTMAAGRFGEIRALARRALEAAGPGTPVSLLLAAGEVRVLATAAEPRERVLAALEGAAPRVAGAGALAAAARAAGAGGAEVLVLTDGCDREAADLRAAPGPGPRVVSVGRPERNRGIVGGVLEVRRDGAEAAFLRVREEDGRIAEWAPGVVPPDPLSPERAGRTALRVDLPAGDALPADDFVAFDYERPRPLRVAVLAPGGKAEAWLAAALESCGALLDAAGSAVLDPSALGNLAAEPDVLVLSGGGAPGARPALVLGAGEGPPQEAPTVQAGDRLHPVLRGVDPAEWIVTRAGTLEARAGDAVLLQGPRGPLALAGEREGARRVLLAFAPGESTLALSASWPVFLRNSLLWLAGGGGGPVLPAARDPAKGPLLDAAESDLAPRLPRDADGFVPPARPAPGAGARPLAAALALGAAALLLAEWLLFALPGAPRRGRGDSFAAPGGGP